jgi:putative ABC transport system permease protein
LAAVVKEVGGFVLDDFRVALRGLLKAPAFAAVVLIPLALGIAASAAAFSILNAVLLRPLPYPEPNRLVILSGRGMTTDRFAAWQQHASSYDALAAFDPGLPMIETAAGPERAHSLLVSHDFFSMLGLRASAGRLLIAEDFTSGSPSIVVTDALATRLFGSSAAALGRILSLAGTGYYNDRYQIVGTLQSIGPVLDEDVSIIMPMLPLPRPELCAAIARLKPGATITAARAEADSLASGFAAATVSRGDPRTVTIERLEDHVLGDSAVTVRLIFAAAILVLLISCANVAHLVLVRSTSRRRDIAVRLALGASRRRLARGLLWESLLLSTCAAVAGLVLARWTVRLLIAHAPYRVPRLADARTDPAVIGFAFLIVLLISLALALAPLWSVRGLDLNSTLVEGSRRVAGSARQRWLRSALVTTEIAITCIVLVAAGLLIETFVTLRPAHPGFNPHGKLVMRIGNTRAKEADSIPLVADLQSRIGALPGVRNVAATSDLPMTGGSWLPSVEVGGRTLTGRSPDAVHVRAVTHNYLSLMQTPIIAGRDLSSADMAQRMRVAVVNYEFARRLLANVNPLGQRVTIASGGPAPEVFEIVGVAANARIVGVSTASSPELYLPFSVSPHRGFYVVTETAGDPSLSAGPVRTIVRALAPGAAITDVQTMDDVVRQSVARPGFHAWLLGSLAGLAVVLALVGIYAVMSYAVAERRHEMGVRIAVGADTRDILALVLRSSLRLTLVGLLIGLPAAFGVSRFLRALLYGTAPSDPRSYFASAAILLTVSLAAGLMPALRAAHVDPIQVLRRE